MPYIQQLGVPLWCSGLGIHQCHHSSWGHCCGEDSIPSPEISTHCRHSQIYTYKCLYIYIYIYVTIKIIYTMVSWSVQLLQQNTIDYVGYEWQKFVLHGSEGWKVQDQGASKLDGCWEPAFLDTYLLTLPFHSGRCKLVFWGCFYRCNNSSHEGSTIRTLSSPPKTTTLWTRISIYEFGGTQTFSP